MVLNACAEDGLRNRTRQTQISATINRLAWPIIIILYPWLHKQHSNNQINPNNVFGLEHWMDAGIPFDFGWVTFSSVGVDIYCFLGMFATPVERLSARSQLSFHDLSLFYSHHIGTDCFSKTQCQKMRFLRKNTEKPLASAFNGCDYRNNTRQKQSFRGVKSVQCHVSCLWLGILEGQFPSGDRGQTCPEAGSASRCAEFAEQHTDGFQAPSKSPWCNDGLVIRKSGVVFLWFFLWFPYGFPMVSLWFPHFVGIFCSDEVCAIDFWVKPPGKRPTPQAFGRGFLYIDIGFFR